VSSSRQSYEWEESFKELRDDFVEKGWGTAEAVAARFSEREQRHQALFSAAAGNVPRSHLQVHAAEYVDWGKGTVAAIVTLFARLVRAEQLQAALAKAGLQGLADEVSELVHDDHDGHNDGYDDDNDIVVDHRCLAYVDHGVVPGDVKLAVLVQTLLEERAARLESLKFLLRAHDITDVYELAECYDSDEENQVPTFYHSAREEDRYKYNEMYGGGDGLEEFADEESSLVSRFSFIELNSGNAQEVVMKMLMYHRFSELTAALEKRGIPTKVAQAGFADRFNCWVSNNDRCQEFVRTGATDTARTIGDLVEMLAQDEIRARGGGGGGGGGAEFDVYYPSWLEDDGGCDWKSHLSGGTYGDDPDADWVWDGYFDD